MLSSIVTHVLLQRAYLGLQQLAGAQRHRQQSCIAWHGMLFCSGEAMIELQLPAAHWTLLLYLGMHDNDGHRLGRALLGHNVLVWRTQPNTEPVMEVRRRPACQVYHNPISTPNVRVDTCDAASMGSMRSCSNSAKKANSAIAAPRFWSAPFWLALAGSRDCMRFNAALNLRSSQGRPPRKSGRLPWSPSSSSLLMVCTHQECWR